MNKLRNFAAAATEAADSLIAQLPEQTQLLATHALTQGYRIALSFEVDQNGRPRIALDLVSDMEQRQNLVECEAELPNNH